MAALHWESESKYYHGNTLDRNLQNKKYRCAMGNTLAGSQVSS
jgi:hypothetical protein